MRLAMRGRAANGLPWRTGVVILATLNLARHAGQDGGTFTDLMLWSCARRLGHPLFGGSLEAARDPSFRVAARVVWAHPGERRSS
jgi:hypothetical protein